MGSRVRRNKEFLGYIAKCSKKQRINCIKNARPDELKSLCDCSLNVYRGNVRLKKPDFEKLYPFRRTLKKISEGKGRAGKKKTLLLQKGGALIPLLLSAVLPSLISSLTQK